MRRMVDLSSREKVVLVPLVVLTILFGVYPNPVLEVTDASVNALVGHVAEATGNPVEGPRIDASAFAMGTGSSTEAVALGLEAAGIEPAEAQTHGEDAHGEQSHTTGEPEATGH